MGAGDRQDALRRQRARQQDARHIALIVALAAIALTIFVLAGCVEPDVAITAGGFGLIAVLILVLLALPPTDLNRFLGRVKSVSLWSLGVEFGDYEGAAPADDAEEPEKDESKGKDRDEDDPAKPLLKLRLRLEAKLTYLAKHVLNPKPDVPTYLTVGSLKVDGLLTEEQARIAEDILTIRDIELRRLPESERRLFLAGAKSFVNTVRVEVFAKRVQQFLDDAEWDALPLPPRRDLLVQSRDTEDGTQHHVIPVFATTEESSFLKPPLERLKEHPRTKLDGKRFIVVPPESDAAERVVDGIAIVTPAELLAQMGPSKSN